jgi:hypothetical protein
MANFTLQVTVQVDVQNAESIQQAREAVFALLSAPKETKSRKGRPTASAQTKATVTGVQIPVAMRFEDLPKQQDLSRIEVTETSP